ncbi:FKBP-type peptidyl-prolyl cis-trans isomerase [uncultured Pseudoteredinibacter sp.]|uniref:FKBP-type peptidyl-prolyl cis-trans isomerase n=1 Tax=uncultured Pseudoteredinibacter sp. TaxID=1641701 RepID=UPI00262DDF66|nr:FKBP-type peptidyl-prolyl cis-trans isomerase [uncultured Pseudoteredinibacter sp.]
MKKFAIAGVAAAVMLVAGCNEQAKKAPEQELVLDTMEKKISYILGYDVAGRFKQDEMSLDAAAISAAVKDIAEDKQSRLTPEEMQSVMTQYQEKQMAKQQEAIEKARIESEKAGEENLAAGQAFLAENAKKEGMQSTESGLQYEVITEGSGPKPTTDDAVQVHYVGTLIDGTEFDSSVARGEPATFKVTQVIPGWTEVLQLMPEGSKWKVYIPSNLAYGPGGTGGIIGPNATLVFEVELLKVNP